MTNQPLPNPHPAAKSWARAKFIAHHAIGLAPDKYEATNPINARKFLARHKAWWPLLDAKHKPDKRNHHLQLILEEYKTWLTNNQTPSKGDPTQPPRAGKPKKHRFLSPEQIPQTRQTTPDTTIELLQELAKLAKKHGGLKELVKAVTRLHELQL